MSKIFSMCLYFASFLPLWISVLFIDIKNLIEGTQNYWTEIISISCIWTGMLFALVVIMVELKIRGKEGSTAYHLTNAKEEKTVTADFLLSYILPLFAFDFTLWDQVVLFLVFFFVLGFICVKHNYFSMNIVLEICNYRFYNCKLNNSDVVELERVIISRRRLNALVGEIVYLKHLNNEYQIDIER